MTTSGITQLGTGLQLDESVNTIISEFKLLRDAIGVIRSTADPLRLEPHRGPSVHWNNYERVVAYNLSDAVDLIQAQQLADARTSWSPGEVGVQVILAGSTLRRGADEALMRNTGRMMANAYDLKEEQDGAAQFSSFTATSLGGAAIILSPGIVAAGETAIAVGNSTATPEPAPGPHFLTAHPGQLHAVWGRIIPLGDAPDGGTGFGVHGGAHAGVSVAAGGGGAGQFAMLKGGPGTLGRIGGIMIKSTPNLNVDSSDDAVAAWYSKEGLKYVEEVAPTPAPDSSDKSMRGAIEMNLWGSYVWGLWRPAAYGRDGTFDASLPTS